MIVLLTDFGIEGPYIGQMKAVLYRNAPGIPIVDLFADLPAFNPRAAAYLLPAYVDEFPQGSVFLCVVDPGVGSARKPLVIYADERWFVGPDNGLFNVVCKRANELRRWVITAKPRGISASFHGRDLFAPVAARLALREDFSGSLLDSSRHPWASWPDDLFEVIYLDRYGNAMTGVRACQLELRHRLVIKKQVMSFARTFSAARPREPFWYENANGLVEFALREGDVSKMLSLSIGDRVYVQKHP